jgi:hypothetical protein
MLNFPPKTPGIWHTVAEQMILHHGLIIQSVSLAWQGKSSRLPANLLKFKGESDYLWRSIIGTSFSLEVETALAMFFQWLKLLFFHSLARAVVCMAEHQNQSGDRCRTVRPGSGPHP